MKKEQSIKKIAYSLFTIAVLVMVIIIGLKNQKDGETMQFIKNPPCKELREPQSEAIELINDYRWQNGLKPLEWNFTLYYTALKKATLIYKGDLPFEHGNYQKMISAYYSDYSMIGENLAKDFFNEAELVKAWQESPTHNEILLSEKACEYGLANYQNIYVLHLGCKGKIKGN